MKHRTPKLSRGDQAKLGLALFGGLTVLTDPVGVTKADIKGPPPVYCEVDVTSAKPTNTRSGIADTLGVDLDDLLVTDRSGNPLSGRPLDMVGGPQGVAYESIQPGDIASAGGVDAERCALIGDAVMNSAGSNPAEVLANSK